MYPYSAAKFKKLKHIDKASQALNERALKKYFAEEMDPTIPKTMELKDSGSYQVDVVKNMEFAMTTSKDVEKVFGRIFPEHEHTGHDLRSVVDDQNKRLADKVISIVENETGINMLEQPEPFFEKDNLKSYQKFYDYLEEMGMDKVIPDYVRDKKDEMARNNDIESLSIVSRLRNKIK